MENRKTIRRKISGRLLRALSADEKERDISDRVREDPEEEPIAELEDEPEEAVSEEASTEMGFVRHIGGPHPS